jgi:uncharacterized protein YbbK (DUF523 family)
MILVSACLAGLDSRYSGESNHNAYIEKLVREGKAIIACPEQLGGCPTPRPPCEIACGASGRDVLEGKGQIIDTEGKNQTKRFVKGAEETLKIARLYNVKSAILKSRSPSCGCGKIYDGTFTGKLIDGNGVAAEILLQNGYQVFTEEDMLKE